MAAVNQSSEAPHHNDPLTDARPKGRGTLQGETWKDFLRKPSSARADSPASVEDSDGIEKRPEKWSLGVLNDKETDEVPGRTVRFCLLDTA